MTPDQPKPLDFHEEILRFTEKFTQTATRIGEAMWDTKFAVSSPEFLEHGLHRGQMIFVSILFTGTVYGEYVIAFSRSTAARLLSIPEATDADPLPAEICETFSEYLNIVVGESVVALGKSYEKLTITAPRVYYGNLNYPQVKTGKALLTSDKGVVECYLYVDKMKLDITSSYKDALGSLLKVHKELRVAMDALQNQQAVLVQSEKMAALGTMAAGVAHEINTPLATVVMAGGQIKDMIADGGADKAFMLKNLDVIESTIFRISKITNSLRVFATGLQSGKRSSVTAASLLDDTLVFCEFTARSKGIKLSCDEVAKGLSLSCYAPQVTQALVNMILNSCDALDSPDVKDEKWIKLTAADAQDCIEFTVTDSGKGIEEKIRDRIFDPFFSTKTIGNGPGLGLSQSKGIIDEHGGTVSLDVTSKNTRFVVRLPKRPKETAAA